MGNENQTTASATVVSEQMCTVTVNREIWQALLKIAGRRIDPENAEVYWRFGQVVDPYGVYADLPPECDCVGWLYFARNFGSSVWIEFGDLPDATRVALERKTRNWLAKLDDEDVPF